MNATLAPRTEPDTYAGPLCLSCGGPCWRWKGSVWQYTCTACIEQYLDESAARGAARDRRDRERELRKMFRDHTSNVSLGGRASTGSGGAPRSVPTTAVRWMPDQLSDLKGQALQCL